MMQESKYGLVRSMLSKCIEPQETGKIFSVLAIMVALTPIIANPIFQQLYNWTLPIFPAAEIILAASVMCISALLNFYIYTQRHCMDSIPEAKKLENNIN